MSKTAASIRVAALSRSPALESSIARPKLIIQIPCFNEEEALPATLAELPRELPGIGRIEWLIVDDGSSDRTVEVARQNGVDHIVQMHQHRGLARAFTTGLEAALAAGADIIVNTDADNQYCAADIPRLIEPILASRADIVVGNRVAGMSDHFSSKKRILQRLGSWVVRQASGTDIPDAPSGFRALSREAALQTNVFGSFTYTLETIIQAGHRGLTVTHVPIGTNRVTRPSRLMRSNLHYICRSAMQIVRIFSIYRAFFFFAILGSVPFGLGFLLGVRWLILFLDAATTRSHVPSLILAAILTLMGFSLWILAFVAQLLSVNRKMLEEIQIDLRRRRHAADRDQPDQPRSIVHLDTGIAAE